MIKIQDIIVWEKDIDGDVELQLGFDKVWLSKDDTLLLAATLEEYANA
jgi:hypothetical protein